MAFGILLNFSTFDLATYYVFATAANTSALAVIMKRHRTITFLVIILFFSSCVYFMKDPEKHEDFMSHCDCFVYKQEVETENFDFGRVELIDTSKASNCVKEQLRNVYLLYYDTLCIAVYNQHPKQNIKTIEFFLEKYLSDTTRLSDFVQFDSSIRITVDRLCKDPDDKVYNGTYVWWREIEYSTLTKPYHQTKDELLQTWYKWTE